MIPTHERGWSTSRALSRGVFYTCTPQELDVPGFSFSQVQAREGLCAAGCSLASPSVTACHPPLPKPELRPCPTVPRWLIRLATALQQLKSNLNSMTFHLRGREGASGEMSFPCPAPEVHVAQQANAPQSMKPIQWGRELNGALERETFPPPGRPFRIQQDPGKGRHRIHTMLPGPLLLQIRDL